MHSFTYKFIKDSLITSDIFQLSNIIANLKAKSEYAKKQNNTIYKKLSKVAIKESIEKSNAIEGIATTSNRIEEICYANSKPVGHDEEEIAGYRDAIIYITENYNNLDLSSKTIKYLHKMIYQYHELNNGGNYKTRDNVIARHNEDGSINRIVFNPVRASEVDKAMEDFCLAANDYLDNEEIPNILLIPCIIVDFLAIHPFKDGNGRVSRLLTLLLLYKEGYDIGKYISYEAMIDKYKYTYYEALEKSQKGWEYNTNSYRPFIIFNLQILYHCYKEISLRFLNFDNEKLNCVNKILKIISNSFVPISKQELKEIMKEYSITSIEKALSDLVKENKIRKIGSNKQARYLAK